MHNFGGITVNKPPRAFEMRHVFRLIQLPSPPGSWYTFSPMFIFATSSLGSPYLPLAIGGGSRLIDVIFNAPIDGLLWRGTMKQACSFLGLKSTHIFFNLPFSTILSSTNNQQKLAVWKIEHVTLKLSYVCIHQPLNNGALKKYQQHHYIYEANFSILTSSWSKPVASTLMSL